MNRTRPKVTSILCTIIASIMNIAEQSNDLFGWQIKANIVTFTGEKCIRVKVLKVNRKTEAHVEFNSLSICLDSLSNGLIWCFFSLSQITTLAHIARMWMQSSIARGNGMGSRRRNDIFPGWLPCEQSHCALINHLRSTCAKTLKEIEMVAFVMCGFCLFDTRSSIHVNCSLAKRFRHFNNIFFCVCVSLSSLQFVSSRYYRPLCAPHQLLHRFGYFCSWHR